LQVRVGHVEAGLRAFDRTMPEEINRVVTDQVSDLLFTPSEDADVNLRVEGIPQEKIQRVGNVMIDTLIHLLPAAKECPRNGFPERFALVTLHRPSNVDDHGGLRNILNSLLELSAQLNIIFPVHPRTRARIAEFGIQVERLQVLEPMPYIEFLALQSRAAVVITDSGGIQEETTYLGIPCLTVRANTERPITVTLGTNVLVGKDGQKLRSEFEKILEGKGKKSTIPPLWDGHAGERVARVLCSS
jgi:UDP-N-acetylglucosamine 2-epimerase (non-hydrolysing)